MAKGKNPSLPWIEKLILEVLREKKGSGFNYKQISSRLGLATRDDRELVEEALRALLSRKEITEISRGQYAVKKTSNLVQGRIEFNKRGAGYLLTDPDEPDIHITPAMTWPALNGDLVEVELIPAKRKDKPEGKVVRIVERARKEYTGLVQVSDGFGFFVPDDTRSHVDFFIPRDKLKGVKNNYKALVKLTDWPQNAKNPNGEVVRILGKAGENDTEIHAILFEFGLEPEYPKAILDEVELLSSEIPAEEIARRRDFRNILTFTIDPFDAKDFDDALSFRELEPGRFEVGVHIADVAHFVEEGTSLDKEAYRRATSVYLVDRVVPMLPERLSNELCSLRPNEDHLCFSVVFELNEEGTILEEWFGKTVIHSARRFSYEEAQEILENGRGDHHHELGMLNRIAKNLKDARFKSGAISFETEEVKFRLDEKGKPVEVIKKIRKDAHKLIEEFMLLANKRVATLVNKKHKPFLIPHRLHEPPVPGKMAEFAAIAARFGHKIQIDNEKTYIKSINKMTRDIEGTLEATILQPLAVRSMEKAFYTTKKTGHFGLGFDYYAHFTSPIRRYPDLLAHRYLFKMLEGEKHIQQSELESACKWCSEREQRAVDAERASIKFKQTEYLSAFVGEEFEGIVTGITEWGIFVEIIQNKCEGMIRLRDMTDDQYDFYEQGRFVMGMRSKVRYQMGDIVNIRVKRTNIAKRLIDFEFVR